MNPFDLRGPPFLLFYVIVAVLGIGWLFRRVRHVQDGRVPDREASLVLRDPYMIAYLRGGASELIRIAIFSMAERKLLEVAGDQVGAGNSVSSRTADNELERAVLRECKGPRDATTLVGSGKLHSAAKDHAEALARNGLIATDADYRERLPAVLAVGLLLGGLAGIKIAVALARGRINILFLIILGMAAIAACIWIFNFHRTALGHQALVHQQTLFGQLKGRVRRLVSRGATNEAIIVAAVFGLATLPRGAFPFAHRITRGNSDTSNSNSSCGGGSSSCGGGGGGGGCGGCGGS